MLPCGTPAVLFAFRKCFTNRCMKTLAALALLKAVKIPSKLCCLRPFSRGEVCKICLLFSWFSPVGYFFVNDFVTSQESNCESD